MNEKWVAVIDLKAFYAYAECIERNLDPFTTPLAVCDESRGYGTIVLSVSPYLKALGVPSRCRRRELPKDIDIILATPRMELYVKKSAEVMSIFLDFIGEDDLHVYSVDEAFLNIGPYLNLYKCTPEELVAKIQKKIKDRLGLCATAGIAPNPFLAKAALDIEGKKKEPYRAVWRVEDVRKKLWPLKPVSKMWGISNGIERRLNRMGIYSIGDLAKTKKELLINEFGVIGEEIWNHANGIDESNIREKYIPEENSFTQGQILHEDYSIKNTELVLREMNDDLCFRLRMANRVTSKVGLFIKYTYDDADGGFTNSMSLEFPTDDNNILYDAIISLFKRGAKPHAYVRGISINFSKLSEPTFEQIDLFTDIKEKEKSKSLLKAIDQVQNIYGKNSILRATSLLEKSTVKERHNQIGGHKK